MRNRRPVITFLAIVLATLIVAAVGGVGTRMLGNGERLTATADAPNLLGSKNARVVGGDIVGQPTFIARWPYLVALLDGTQGPQQSDAQFCAGALVTPTKVVTAAHCAQRVAQAKMFVLTGTEYLDDDWDSQLLRVSGIAIDPTWGGPTALGGGGDIAVLTLASASTSPTIQVVGAGEDAIWGAGKGVTTDDTRGPWVVGWGDIEEGAGDYYPAFPFQAAVPMYSDSSCKATLGSGLDTTQILCGGVLGTTSTLGKGACSGDSGGPIMTMANANPRLIGVVSFGIGDCSHAKPDGYSKLAGSREWLRGQGVPISSGKFAGPLPAPPELGAAPTPAPTPAPAPPSTTGGGTVSGGGGAAPAPAPVPAPTGPALALLTPANGFRAKSAKDQVMLSWSARSDLDTGEFLLFQGTRALLRAPAPGTTGINLPLLGLPSGPITWCMTAVERTARKQVDRTCRTLVVPAIHDAGVTKISIRGKRVIVKGMLASNARAVTVRVVVKSGGAVIRSSTLKVQPKALLKDTSFTFTHALGGFSLARTATATITVSGGGRSQTFTNILRARR